MYPIMRFLTLILVVLAFPAWAAPPLLGAKQIILDNGITVVVVENHRASVITHMVWYKAGSADEPYGHSGAAHFLEHLMFKGSKGIPAGAFSRKIKAMGGQDNAFTGHDYTAYYQCVPAPYLADVMRMEASRMRGLSPPEQEITKEHAVIIQERAQHTDSDPNAQFYEVLMAALFPNHPYGRPVIGWPAEVENLDWKTAKTFYDRFYAPQNSVVIISGDIKAPQAFALAREIYGNIKYHAAPRPARPVVPPLQGRIRVEHTHESLRQGALYRLWRVPSRARDSKTSYALEVAADLLGGGPTSWLYRSLVVEQKLASAVDLSYDPYRVDESTMILSAWPAHGVSMAQLETALDNALTSFKPTQNMIRIAKDRLMAEALYARDSLMGPAMIIGTALCAGETLEMLEAWPARIGQVKKKDVRDSVQKWMTSPNAHFVTGYLNPLAMK